MIMIAYSINRDINPLRDSTARDNWMPNFLRHSEYIIYYMHTPHEHIKHLEI